MSVVKPASSSQFPFRYASVQEQTGIFAGKGGFDITAGNHTQLDGAVIASTATPDKNKLNTGTLGWSDIRNEAEYKVEHQSVGVSSGGGNIGSQFVGNMANSLLTGVNRSDSASSTTKAAVSGGAITVRDQTNQQQDVANLSRDAEHANQTLSPIFDKEKEQQRLKEAQLIAEIGSQAGDIARTQGEIAGLKAQKDPAALKAAREQLTASGKAFTEEDVAKQAYNNAMAPYGTGSSLQRGIQAATAAIQGLAGGNIGQAVSGAAAPYLAEQIHKLTEGNPAAKAMAHAVVGAVASYASGNSALAGAAGAVSGELMAQLVMKQLYPGKAVSELTEEQKQAISALGTLAAGLAGGVTGNGTADAVAGAQAGKNAVENNFLTGDMYALDRKVKAAKEKGEDIEPILEDARKQSLKDREKMEASCKANPDTCGFSRDAANDAQNEILENGPFLNIDPDVAKLVAQETAKDNAVISQNTSEFGKGLVVASEGLSIIVGMGTSAALNVLKTGGAIRDPKTGSTVTVYRVEGAPNTRVLIGEKGQITITGETTLYLNFGDKARAQEFLQKRISQNMEEATIKTFEVPTSVLNDLRNSAVKESVARLPENKGKPVIADPTKAVDQYGIRPDKLKELQDKIVQGSGKDEYKR